MYVVLGLPLVVCPCCGCHNTSFDALLLWALCLTLARKLWEVTFGPSKKRLVLCGKIEDCEEQSTPNYEITPGFKPFILNV